MLIPGKFWTFVTGGGFHFAVDAGRRAGRTGRASDLLRLKRTGHRQKNASEDAVEEDVSSQFR